MELDKIKEHIAEIFKKENVKHVFYVDDRVNKFADRKQELLARLRVSEGVIDNDAFKEILVRNSIDPSDDLDILISQIDSSITPTSSDLLSALTPFLGSQPNTSAVDDEDNDALDIQQYFGRGQFTALAPDYNTPHFRDQGAGLLS
jgi:hypothetical protein